MNRTSLIRILSIALAIVVPALLAVQAHHEISSSPVVRIKMMGYDPRDLLYGHYLQFRYDWNWDNEKQQTCTNGECCLCVEAKEIEPKVYGMSCEAAKTDATCGHVIKGELWGDRNFSNGPPTQFFIDERHALQVEDFFRRNAGKINFHMGLSLPRTGKAKIEKLYIDGKPYQDYMAEHPDDFIIDYGSPAVPEIQPDPVPVEPATP